MDTDEQFDESITKWFEETAPARLPERVFDATFERTRRSRQQVGLRAFLTRLQFTRIAPAIGGAAAIVVVALLGLNLLADRPAIVGPSATPASPFVGDWEATDPPPDSSHLTMEVVALPNDTYGLTIRDDFASVCSGAPSTMTGVAKTREPRTIVIAQPEFVCDDGSEAQALSGPPLLEQLRNLGFTYDPQRDEVQDSVGLVWSRAAVGPTAPPSNAEETPTASPSPAVGTYPPSYCVDLYADGGTYRVPVGNLSMTTTVPAGWHGLRDQFYLLRSPCTFGGPVQLEASLVSHVYADACDWRGTAVEATTPAAVTAALAAQKGHETIGPTDTTIGAHPASRFELSFPADIDYTQCDDGTSWLFPGDPDGHSLDNVDPGTTMTVDVVDLDGLTLVVAARLADEDATADLLAEVDSIVDTLRFGPGVDGSATPAPASPQPSSSPSASPSPSSSPWPSPSHGFSRFTSTINGITIDYPAGWRTSPATEPWTDRVVTFGDSDVDFIFDPDLQEDLYSPWPRSRSAAAPTTIGDPASSTLPGGCAEGRTTAGTWAPSSSMAPPAGS